MPARFTTPTLDRLTAVGRRLVFVVATLFAAPALATVAPGTSVDNTAAMSYVASGSNSNASSNAVRAIVAVSQRATLSPASATIRANGNAFVDPAKLTNTGNQPTTFFVNATASGGFVPTGLQVVIDTNGNGIVDGGDTVVTPTTPITLAPGASASLLVGGTIPAATSTSATTTIALGVQSQDRTVTAASTATIVTGGPANVTVTNSASAKPMQGQDTTFTLSSTTDAALQGANVTVDGTATTFVLMSAPIPTGMVLTTAAPGPGETMLYHHRGDPVGAWTTTPPAVGSRSTIDMVAFAAPSLAAGTTLSGSVTGIILQTFSGTISSTSTMQFNDQGNARSVPSNTVTLTLVALVPLLQIYTSNSYLRPAASFAPGNNLFLQMTAPGCAGDPTRAESHLIRVDAAKSGDFEFVTVTETAPDSGVFRSDTPIRTVDSKLPDPHHVDGFLTVFDNDQVWARPVDCGDGAVASTLVDPAGVVFDSRSNAPVAGSIVTLIDVSGNGNGGKPGQPAIVFDYDGVTTAPSTVTTLADGSYRFPLVSPSTYKLVVTPPPGYTGPSKVASSDLPAGHDINATGSYGGNFIVANELVTLDYPVDAAPISGLFVEKTASKTVAEIGDFVDYAVTVRNTASVAIPSVVLHDRLPHGFVFQSGTARIAGVKATDPTGTAVRDIALGTIAPSQSITVSYRLRIGVGAKGGDGVNRATATAGITQSNEASVKVRLDDGGVFSDRAYLIGKVFADCNGNGVQDAGEHGVPDVRIVLEDGTSATTDEDGKYSLYGLLPRTHVAKVDASTLPEGATLEVLDNRNAGDGNSRFVDLKNGELARANFAIAGCSPALVASLAERRVRATRIGEAETSSKALLSAQKIVAVDARTLPSSGTLDAKGIATNNRTPLVADALPSTSDVSNANLPQTWMHANVQSGNAVAKPLPAQPLSLSDLLPTLSKDLGFVDLVDGAVMPSTQATIRAKGPSNVDWTLVVDGKAVETNHIGERTVRGDVAVAEYVGVELKQGRNHLELVARDGFGNTRDRTAVDVRVAGRIAKIVVDAPAEIKADGRSIVKLRVKLVDADGLPVAGRVGVTLDATMGRLLVTDLDPREPGIQAMIENGEREFDFVAPVDAGRGVLRTQVGALVVDTPLLFVPDLRPLMAVGLVEGVFNLRSLGSNAIQGVNTGDAFEREIRNVTRSWDDGKMSAEARGALYLKGKVLGSTLLTVAYDSDKPQGERLFRDIQPDQFYPVYGDSSVKGFDAQSTSRLYVRVDQGQSYALYGDFTTQTDDPARPLTQYNRALTGGKSHVELGPVKVDGFAAYTSSQQVVDELPGNGTSGPFALSRPNGVVNSEQVHVLTRDRNQPAIVIKDVPMTRFSDYEIEPLTGRLLFKLPIPSVDADLNPISIRITYEVDDGGQKFWVGGVDAKVAVTDQASIGGVYIRDTDPSNRSTLRGVNGTVRLSEHALLVGEFAETDSDLYGLGRGRRIEYKQEEEGFQARVYGGKTDVSFVNPNALLSQGRGEYGAKIGVRLSEQDRLSIEGIRSEDPVTGGKRTGVLARVERTFADNVKLELGIRRVDETVAPAQATALGTTPADFTSLRAKLTTPVPFVKDATVFAEYERALGDGDKQVAALGGSYVLPQGGKLYVRHEFISSLSGAYDLNSTQRLTTTVVGVDSDYMKDGHVFNEYRVGGGIDGRSSEAAIGLRNLWRIADGMNVTTTAENVKPMGGPVDDRATAVTGAIDYTAATNWKGSARAEYRNGTSQDSWLMTTGAAYKLNEETTLLAKAIYSDLANAVAGSASTGRRVARAQAGAAFRPADTDVWNALARIEVKREQDSTIVAAPVDEIATIASLHVNVMPTPDLSFNARYGIKRATDRSNGFDSHSTTQLLGGRMIKDLDDKWDVGVNAYVLASDGFKSRQYALGVEAGYRVATNLWVSTGYNVSGFKDKDLASEEYTQRGAYLRMRYKFDESVFGGKKSGAGS